ncbi:MAG TPA: transcription antitermination factor NusB [Bacteroidales bacterium]|nr:transcription antitermination factor NusB [Bacteroidales bacterium]
MAFYAFNRRNDDNLSQAEKELMFSIEKTYDLYHYLLLLVLEIADIAAEKIDMALHKRIPTTEDLNPNTRFVDNLILNQLRNSEDFTSYISKKKLSWVNSHVPRLLYTKMLTWEPYKEYLSTTTGFSADKKFFISIINELFLTSEDLQAYLEEQSIYWNDDIEYVSAMAEKTIRKFRQGNLQNTLMPLFKNEEDKEFVKVLLRKAIMNDKKTSELIDKNTTNWEVERIALMDILVMKLAITEILEFQEIPVRVTLNEYIELAKYYCTSKSSTFVNGILDKIVKEMRDEGFLKKTGRGLMGEALTD